MKPDNVPYIIQLVDDAGVVVFRENQTVHDTTFEFQHLDPRLYRIKWIRDKNENGKWDTGDYLKHIQPEEVDFYPESITVRANWDVDVLVKLQFILQKNKQ